MREVIANVAGALSAFTVALAYMKRRGLCGEVDRQREATLHHFSEPDFLREAAWVVLCSGFRESTVRALFDFISLSFCDWSSADEIAEQQVACKTAAMRAFNNSKKIDAIVRIAMTVSEVGFETLRGDIMQDPLERLRLFPYIGPVTVYHLAKNLGFDVAKPDRHLVRLSSALGFSDAASLCENISCQFDEPVSVVDIVLWRYLADNGLTTPSGDPFWCAAERNTSS